MTIENNGFGRRFFARWIEGACRFAWFIIIGTALLTAGALYYAVNNVSVDASVDKMLSPSLPFRQNEIAINEAFPLSNGTLSIIVEARTAEQADDAAGKLAKTLRARTDRFKSIFFPEGLTFLRQNGLLYLDETELESLADRLAEAQPLLAGISADPSLRGLADILSLALENATAESATAFGPALRRMTATVNALAEGKDARLSWQTLLSDDTDDKTASRRFIIAQPVVDFGSLSPVSEAMTVIRDVTAKLGFDTDDTVRVRVTGTQLMRQEELQTVKDGMGLVGILSFTIVLVLLALGLRSARLVIAALMTLVVGLILTAAFAVAAFSALNLISVAFAVLFIGLSVDFGIHFTLRSREEMANAGSTGDALREAAKGVGGPLLLSALAAALGFLSFLPTDYRGVSELGVISGAGMFIALVANMTLLPALLYVMRVRASENPGSGQARSPLRGLVQSHPRKIVIGAAIIGIAATAITPFAQFDEDPLNLRDPNSPSVATLLDLLKDARTEPYSAELLVQDLATADQLARHLRALPEVKNATTISDLVPDNQETKKEIIEETALVLTPVFMGTGGAESLSDAARQKALASLQTALKAPNSGILPDAEKLAAALSKLPATAEARKRLEDALLGDFPLFRDRLSDLMQPDGITLETIPAPLRDRQISKDGRALITIKPRDDLRDADARRRFAAAVQKVTPTASGSAIRYSAVKDAVVGSFQQAAVLALIMIVLLLFAVLRRIPDVLMVLSPLALAVVITVAVTVIFQTPFNLANIIVLPLILGLGVAFGIHIVLRHRDEGDDKMLETSTPRAVLFSALTTIGSFGALTLSNHPGTASMGYLLTLSVSLTMLCTLIVLPALLELFGRREADR